MPLKAPQGTLFRKPRRSLAPLNAFFRYTVMDLQLAGEVEGIDLIVGGQSRDVLEPPVWIEPSGTVIAQAGYRGEWIGVVSLEIASQGTVISHGGQVVPLTEEFADDPEMRAFLDQYK